jgi:two-component system chemotaxis response regulator CheB
LFDRLKKRKEQVKPAMPEKLKGKFSPEIVLIAASTGGPFALKSILSNLPCNFPVPVLIVQHMPQYFSENLAQHLNQQSKLKIKVAESRETITAGTVYIAPGDKHMKLDRKKKIYLDNSPPVNGIRPAADILFESVAESFLDTRVLAIILTGMGDDGKKGLAKLKEKQNCLCYTQSENTCVVYGMPRAAAENGLADRVLDLDEIPYEIENLFSDTYNKTRDNCKVK